MGYALTATLTNGFDDTLQRTRAALQAEPSIGLLLPCNVVVRALDDAHTLVEAVDPSVMVTLTGNEDLADVAADARGRLTAALEALTSDDTEAAGHGRPQP